MLKPATLAWAHFNGPTSLKHAPLGPLWCKVIMHKKTNALPSWDFRGKNGCLFKIWADPSQLTTVPLISKTKIKDNGNRRKACIPPTPKIRIHPTPPPPTATKPTTAEQSPRGDFPGVAAPDPKVETSDPRAENPQPHQAATLEPVARHTRSHQSPPTPIPTELITQRTTHVLTHS